MSDNFHVYAVEWEEGVIRWYVNGRHYATQDSWSTTGADFPAPFDQNFHLIMNVAVGGVWPGSPDENTVFPQAMEVDYVRVYQCSTAGVDGKGGGTVDPSVTPGTFNSNQEPAANSKSLGVFYKLTKAKPYKIPWHLSAKTARKGRYQALDPSITGLYSGPDNLKEVLGMISELNWYTMAERCLWRVAQRYNS